MRAGQLDRRITIQRPVDVEDPVYGPQEGGWENLLPLRIPANKKDALPSKTAVCRCRIAPRAFGSDTVKISPRTCA
jgi:hypothetical protein